VLGVEDLGALAVAEDELVEARQEQLGAGVGHRREPLGRRRVEQQAVVVGDEVLARALEGLAQEIRIMLDEGVVAAPEDIDLCMILGAGWPFHLGGITPYLDRTGIAEKVTGARFR